MALPSGLSWRSYLNSPESYTRLRKQPEPATPEYLSFVAYQFLLSAVLVGSITHSALTCSLNRGYFNRLAGHLPGHPYFLASKFSRLVLTRFVELVDSFVVLVGQ